MTITDPTPVEVSDSALRVLTAKVREWAGVNDITLRNSQPPTGSPWAAYNIDTHQMYANLDALILNPNRVLRTVTPFRLRQEAVLTGALMHEAAHARFTKWGEFSDTTQAAVDFAALFEEARIETCMIRHLKGAGLSWTLRAMAIRLMPVTSLHLTDANAQIMDLINSWVLRAGRRIGAVQAVDSIGYPTWVRDFNALLIRSLSAHLSQFDKYADDPVGKANWVYTRMTEMILSTDDTGKENVRLAGEILAVLFPETPAPAIPGPPCKAEQAESEDSDDESDEGDDEADGADGADEADADGADEADGADDGEADGADADEADADGEGEGEGDDESEGDQPSAESQSLARELAAIEAASQREAKDDAKDSAEADKQQAETEQRQVPSTGAGGEAGGFGSGYTQPDADQRDVQKQAGRFLRDLIDPSEQTFVTINDSPSSQIDPAAMAAWKASGRTTAPRFFKHTNRRTEAAPPVQIAVLVDVSLSMGVLQKPSALLSWALSAAAIDLRNFAGRGQQVESCLIHWGTSVEVVQGVGQMLPGIRTAPCNQGTNAMGAALAAVEQEMPGFFEASDKPVNRLLVQFTDWELGASVYSTAPWVHRALAAGVNMLSIVPSSYSGSGRWVRSSLGPIMQDATIQRGRSHVVPYNHNPAEVWEQAKIMLNT